MDEGAKTYLIAVLSRDGQPHGVAIDRDIEALNKPVAFSEQKAEKSPPPDPNDFSEVFRWFDATISVYRNASGQRQMAIIGRQYPDVHCVLAKCLNGSKHFLN